MNQNFSIIIDDLKHLIKDLNYTIHHFTDKYYPINFVQTNNIKDVIKSEDYTLYYIITIFTVVSFLFFNRSNRNYNTIFDKIFFKVVYPLLLSVPMLLINTINIWIRICFFLIGKIRFREIFNMEYKIESSEDYNFNIVWYANNSHDYNQINE